MTRNIKTAPTLTRKLVKRAPYLRRQINAASKSEQAGQQGATQQRERLTADFAKDIHAAEAAIQQAHAAADDFDKAAIILKSKTELRTGGLVSALANVAVRLNCNHSPMADLTAAAASRAKEAADAAQDRLDTAEPELRSVALLAQLSALLPSVKFDSKHPRVQGVRRDYLTATAIAASRRKAQK